MEKLNGRWLCSADLGTRGNIFSLRASLLPEVAAFDSESTRLADWVGNSSGRESGALNRGGCPANEPKPAGGGREGGAPPRTVPRRGRAAGRKGHSPCPMTRKSRSRARLLKMGASCLPAAAADAIAPAAPAAAAGSLGHDYRKVMKAIASSPTGC